MTLTIWDSNARGPRPTSGHAGRALCRGALALLLALFAAATLAAPPLLQRWQGDTRPPALELNSLDGRRVALADLRGKVVLVNFWATWCGPCVEEMPSLQLLRQQLGTDDFEILAVNLKEGEPRIRRFLENLPLSFEILRDTDGAVARSWKVRIYPSSFVVDADGRLRHFVVGATDWSAAAVQKPLRDLLQSRRGNAVRR